MIDDDRRALKAGEWVEVRHDDGTHRVHEVTRGPWALGHGAWVVGLSGVPGGYALDRVVRRASQEFSSIRPAPEGVTVSLNVTCPTCGGTVGRDGTRRLTCPLCDVPGVNGVCGRCDGVTPANLMTTWFGDGYAEVVCFPCARDASIGVPDCAG
jgi:hypothetical protein